MLPGTVFQGGVHQGAALPSVVFPGMVLVFRGKVLPSAVSQADEALGHVPPT
jgi:hypothetical protein